MSSTHLQKKPHNYIKYIKKKKLTDVKESSPFLLLLFIIIKDDSNDIVFPVCIQAISFASLKRDDLQQGSLSGFRQPAVNVPLVGQVVQDTVTVQRC